MNKISTIAKYAFKEDLFFFNPRKKIANLPKNYLLRLITILWSYLFLGYIYFGVMKGALAIYGKNGQAPMYFMTFALLLSVIVIFMYGPRIYGNFFAQKSIAPYQTLPIARGTYLLER